MPNQEPSKLSAREEAELMADIAEAWAWAIRQTKSPHLKIDMKRWRHVDISRVLDRLFNLMQKPEHGGWKVVRHGADYYVLGNSTTHAHGPFDEANPPLPGYERYKTGMQLFGYLMPRRLRRRVYQNSVNELLEDTLVAFAAARGRGQRIWLYFSFFVRTLLLWSECLWCLATDFLRRLLPKWLIDLLSRIQSGLR